jgi:hypothetical protein
MVTRLLVTRNRTPAARGGCRRWSSARKAEAAETANRRQRLRRDKNGRDKQAFYRNK